jgi:hypothetical protein
MTDYQGPATIDGVTVEVHLSAHFEPVEGRYRWAGRAAPNAQLTARMRDRHHVSVQIGQQAADARLGEPDPWGRVRISGTGRPPWPEDPGD